MRIGYLGPRTNSEKALEMVRGDFVRVAFPTMEEVLAALQMKEVERIVVPVRNSITGTIGTYLTQIKQQKFKIKDKFWVPVEHSLGVAGREVGFIMSHQQGLDQCVEYLNLHHRGIYKEATRSTDFAARFVSEIGHGAAIAPEATCIYHGLRVVERNIVKDNKSLFYLCKR